MITIGQRVQYAIEAVERGEFEHALQHAAIGIDLTAKQYYGASENNANYKDFLKEYSWLIEMMALGTANIDESKFGTYQILPVSDASIKEPTFQDFLYNIIRCGLVHDAVMPACFNCLDKDNSICNQAIMTLPNKLIWGLLAVIVFCPVNKSQKTSDGYWLSFSEHKFVINEAWGQEELIRSVYEDKKPVSFAPRISDDYFNIYNSKNSYKPM